MNNRNRAINAYKSESDKGKKKEEPTGFLKLTKEKVDYKKIAKFLLLLGRDEAVKVMRHLSPGEVEKISQEISHTDRVDKVEAESLLKEFGFDSEREPRRARGGVDTASEILTKAFGEEESERLLKKAVPEELEGPFSFLNDLEFEQLIMLLKEESAQVISLVLRYLDPSLASEVLKNIDKKLSTAIIRRIAKGGPVSLEVIKGMEESLREKIRNQGKVDSEEIDGPSALAGILKYMNIEDEQSILQSLSSEDESMGCHIREKLFTIDTVLHMDRNDLQKVLSEFSEKDLALMLRVVDDEVKKKIRGSLSTGQLVLIDEEDSYMGKIRKTDADEKVRDFLKLLRKREEEGAFIVIREEDELIE